MKDILISRDSKGKFRQVIYELEKTDTGYIIHRSSGLVDGKQIIQPNIVITTGKAKRSVKEQADLQYNSLVQHQLDKGYKNIKDLNIVNVNTKELEKIMPKVNTDQNGIGKPMLCKVYDFTDAKNNGITWYCSRKHDGLRTFLYYKDGKVQTASRGGKDYNIAAKYILEDEFIKNFFKNNPNIILDGELYRHGWPLSKISGLGRLETNVEDHKQLNFHCYDIADESKTFEERLEILNNIKKTIDLNHIQTKLVIVDHYKLSNNEAIKAYHDIFVKEGYEGAVVRDGSKKYKFDARDRRMQKIKLMDTTTFKILDYELGLRGAEDMCFVLETKDGKQFKAKPEGDLALKQYYVDNFDSIKGKPGDVRFFHYTEYGIPNLPVFVAIRDDLDE